MYQEVAASFDKLEGEILSDEDDDMNDDDDDDNVSLSDANVEKDLKKPLLKSLKKLSGKKQVKTCKNLAKQLISLIEVSRADSIKGFLLL